MQLLLEAVPDAMVIVDGHGLIVMVNSRFEHLLGWRRADLLGKGFDVFVPERLRAGPPELRAGFIQPPKLRRLSADLESYALRSDRTEFPAEIALGSSQTDTGRLVSVLVRDVVKPVKYVEFTKVARQLGLYWTAVKPPAARGLSEAVSPSGFRARRDQPIRQGRPIGRWRCGPQSCGPCHWPCLACGSPSPSRCPGRWPGH